MNSAYGQQRTIPCSECRKAKAKCDPGEGGGCTRCLRHGLNCSGPQLTSRAHRRIADEATEGVIVFDTNLQVLAGTGGQPTASTSQRQNHRQGPQMAPQHGTDPRTRRRRSPQDEPSRRPMSPNRTPATHTMIPHALDMLHTPTYLQHNQAPLATNMYSHSNTNLTQASYMSSIPPIPQGYNNAPMPFAYEVPQFSDANFEDLFSNPEDQQQFPMGNQYQNGPHYPNYSGY